MYAKNAFEIKRGHLAASRGPAQLRSVNQSDCLVWQTNQSDISKEQGLAAGVLSPLLPSSSNFCRNAYNAGVRFAALISLLPQVHVGYPELTYNITNLRIN